MKRFLVLQLARLGDLVQTKRLIRSLARPDAGSGTPEVHLCLDASLVPLARRVYPEVRLHPLTAHGLPGPGSIEAASAVVANRPVLADLAGLDVEAVYCCNFAGLNLALTGLFDPARVRGYHRENGQDLKDSWPRLAFRLMRDRTRSALNLADFWAHFHPAPMDPAAVNPEARPGGRGLGVALSGREARRSPPPEVLAPIIQTLFAATGGRAVHLFGARDQSPLARALLRRLPPAVADKTADLCGKTGLGDLPEALAGLDALLTPDTGLMHLAAHLGVPVTALFLSSAHCFETGPYGRGHTVWQAATSCAPCLESAPCPNALACLAPFADPAFARLAAGRSGASLPPDLLGLRSERDALGATLIPFAGQDPKAEARARLRTFLARRLGLVDPADGPPTPDEAHGLWNGPDVFLPGRPPRPDILEVT